MTGVPAERRNRIVEIYHDRTAHVVTWAGIAYHLTPCCDASAEGSMGSIVCRSCSQRRCACLRRIRPVGIRQMD